MTLFTTKKPTRHSIDFCFMALSPEKGYSLTFADGAQQEMAERLLIGEETARSLVRLS